VILLYGLRHVGSGLGSVVNSAMTPISLFAFALAFGQEKFSRYHAAAVALGVAGILVLFGPKALAGQLDPAEALGALAIIVACLCNSLGSVLARPLLRTYSPAELATLSNLIGGVVLLVLSLAFEPGARESLHGNWGAAAWAGWLYMLLPGSLGATIIYLVLMRDWGASRTGTYAFVSPVIAVLLGTLVLGEPLGVSDAAGMAMMLAAAVFALRPAEIRAPAVAAPALVLSRPPPTGR
jgi:drug/metabolite transporter (DMT)-like permease